MMKDLIIFKSSVAANIIMVYNNGILFKQKHLSEDYVNWFI